MKAINKTLKNLKLNFNYILIESSCSKQAVEVDYTLDLTVLKRSKFLSFLLYKVTNACVSKVGVSGRQFIPKYRASICNGVLHITRMLKRGTINESHALIEHDKLRFFAIQILGC